MDLGLRTIVIFVSAGFISAFFPARLPMLFGPFFAGGCLGVLLAGYLWKAGDQQSWNLLALPGAFLVAFPFALVSGTGVLAFIDIVTRNSLDDGILDALVIFTIGASGAVPVFAAFILLRLREPIVSVLGPSLCFAIVPGIASVVVFYLTDLKTGNAMITNPQPQLLVVWQTTVAGLLGYLEAEGEEQQTEPPESVTQA